MNIYETDMAELGTVSAETRGLANNGSEDTADGQKYLLGGIETDD